MNKKNGTDRSGIKNILNEKRTANIALIVLLLSILPILIIAPFGYASADDLGYGATVRRVLVNNGSAIDVFTAVIDEIRQIYYGWQGTWSSVFMFCFEPSIWGEKFYVITPWIGLAFLLGGTWLFLHHFIGSNNCGFTKCCRLSSNTNKAVFAVLMFFTVQYMPYMRGGIFWYTSMIHYTFPYGIALACIVWADIFLNNGSKKVFAALIFCMAFLGGSGYPAIVLAGEGTVIVFLFHCFKRKESGNKSLTVRRIMIFVPLLLLAAGFVISALAPGNKVRGGESFGFSLSKIVNTIEQSFVHNFTDSIGYIAEHKIIILLIPVVIVLTAVGSVNKDNERSKVSLWQVLIVTVICIVVSSSMYAPGIYAGVDVSGGVPDTIYYVSMLMFTVWLISVTLWCRNMFCRKNGNDSKGDFELEYIRAGLVVVLLICAVLFHRQFLANSIDYTIYNFWSSGRLEDYSDQMKERISILNSADENVIVQAMNEDQGPFMCMALTDDKSSVVNGQTADFYGKESVIAIPREEFNKE